MAKVVALVPDYAEWLGRCAKRLQCHGPELWEEFAMDLAGVLHNAWPSLPPEVAADKFLARSSSARR
jgi:hypothetical protein